MNRMTRTNPLLSRDVFSDFFNQFLRGREDDSTIDTSLWSPAVDIHENPKEYTVTADLPGIEEKDLKVTLENNILTIQGHRGFEKKEEKEGYSRLERFQGQFYRRFSLPEAIDNSKIEAVYSKGVLQVHIPKRSDAGSKSIKVKVHN